jgi:hypothetical protein
VLLVILLGMVAHAVYLSCVAEDAFISFRFARHLALGEGFVWNIGEPAVEGYTNFFWVVLMAFVLKFGLGPEIPSQVLGILATGVSILFVYRISCLLQGDLKSPFRFVAPGLMAASGAIATWAASGMETNLFMAFVTMALFYYLRDLDCEGPGWESAFCLLLAGLTRPEGVLVFALLWAHYAMRGVASRRPPFKDRRFLRWTLVYLIPGLVYFVWRYAYFGYLLPNAFYAKGAGSIHHLERGVDYVVLFARIFLLPALLLLPALVMVIVGQRKNARIRVAWWLVPTVLLLVAYVGYIVYVGGDYMAMFRFVVPIIPLFYLLVQEATRLGFVYSPSWLRPGYLVLLGVFLIVTLLPSITTEQMREHGLPEWIVRHYRKPPFMHGYADGVRLERWHAARLALIGRFFKSFAGSAEESVLTSAIGAVSYYSEIKVYGQHGLVDTHIAHLKHRVDGRVIPGHEKGDTEYLLNKRPTFIMVTRGLSPRFVPKSVLAGEFIPAIRDAYLPQYDVINVPMIDRKNGERGYFPFLALKGRTGRLGSSVFDPD